MLSDEYVLGECEPIDEENDEFMHMLFAPKDYVDKLKFEYERRCSNHGENACRKAC